jgi:hypothetical protein
MCEGTKVVLSKRLKFGSTQFLARTEGSYLVCHIFCLLGEALDNGAFTCLARKWATHIRTKSINLQVTRFVQPVVQPIILRCTCFMSLHLSAAFVTHFSLFVVQKETLNDASAAVLNIL